MRTTRYLAATAIVLLAGSAFAGTPRYFLTRLKNTSESERGVRTTGG